MHHSASGNQDEGDAALDEIGLVFKTPPPKLTVNPFTGEELDDNDNRSVASSRMSSRSTTSRWGRDGDGQVNREEDDESLIWARKISNLSDHQFI